MISSKTPFRMFLDNIIRKYTPLPNRLQSNILCYIIYVNRYERLFRKRTFSAFETLSACLYKNGKRHIYSNNFRICRAINELSDGITTTTTRPTLWQYGH